MECYIPPAQMRAKYLSYVAGVVSPGADVFLHIPPHQMHFGTQVRDYLTQMDKGYAGRIAAAGVPFILQFGETQAGVSTTRATTRTGGMGLYDQQVIDDSAAQYGYQIRPFRANNDNPAGNPAWLKSYCSREDNCFTK
ncbi:MAG: hypothetical protein LC130_21440 [Bryobacterales bacterium]|nr:hypothetical protein [Bryobacterales bacterium]MEB2362243.1 hypothetical protein [Bryobacterales bacterium]